MPRKKAENSAPGTPMSKMDAVRAVLRADPHIKPTALSKTAKSQYGVDISPKMAATYRYHIQRSEKRSQRKAVRAAAGPVSTEKSAGIDNLLRAAQILGWQRVKDIVDQVVHAPA